MSPQRWWPFSYTQIAMVTAIQLWRLTLDSPRGPLGTAPLLALGACLLLVGCERDRLDRQISELCAKDGGVKVYEQVKVPADLFDRRGLPNFYKPTAGENALGPEYVFRQERHYYARGNPEAWRVHRKVVRRADGKVLSEETVYIRRGGDAPSPMHDSSFTCPPLKDLGLIEKTFVRQARAG